MHLLTGPLFLLSLSLHVLGDVPATPPSLTPYSSTFREPNPPLLQAEFTASYMQHKYDAIEHNNIVAGFAYFSPSARKVRADGAFDCQLESSQFDSSNVSAQGEVANTLLTFKGGVKQSQRGCGSFFQVSSWPLFTSDILQKNQAVYIGIQNDALYGSVSAWQFVYTPPGVLVTVYLDANNTLVRFDYSDPGSVARTFATTRFFNIVLGPIDPIVFETDCT